MSESRLDSDCSSGRRPGLPGMHRWQAGRLFGVTGLPVSGNSPGRALILLETADLRFAVPDLNRELTLRQFLAFAQVFKQVTKG